MTIKSVEGNDWEGYDYLSLELSNRVNTVIGKSHSGKSSIVRLLRWVLENTPSGTSYFPHNKKKPSVEGCIEFEEGTFITRKREVMTNTGEYEVSTNSEPFSALRSGVPDKVREISNIKDINIQTQKDVHWFLTETAGKRAKMLNEVAGLEEMDIAIGIINSDTSQIKSEYDFKTKELTKFEDKAESLKWILNAELEMNAVDSVERYILLHRKNKQDIESILSDIQKLRTEYNELPDTGAITLIDDILSFDAELSKLEEKEDTLEKTLLTLQILISEEKGITLPTASQISKFEGITVELDSNKKIRDRILYLQQDIIDLESELKLVNKEVIAQEKLFNSTLKEMGKCPLCER